MRAKTIIIPTIRVKARVSIKFSYIIRGVHAIKA